MTKVKSEGLEVLVVGVKWPPETFIQRKLQGLASEGFKVTVATAVPRAKGKATLAGVTLVRLSHTDDFPLTSLFRLLSDAFMLAVTARDRVMPIVHAVRAQGESSPKAVFASLRAYLPLARLRPDIVHFEWNSAAIQYAALTDIWGCPTVVSCRGGQINVRPHVPGNETLVAGLRESFQTADAVHCVSNAIRDEAEAYGLDCSKAVVIPPCVDPDVFKPAEQKTKDSIFRIVTVGTINWRKGFEFALVALRKLADQGVPAHLEIIGDGPERQRILYTIHDLNLQDHVSLAGRLSPEQIRTRLQQSDAFLLSSHSEGISNAVLEAMACGLPIVTTECGGMGEAVTDGVEGFVVPVRDADAMSEALRKLASDPDLRANMGVAARQRIVSSFSLALADSTVCRALFQAGAKGASCVRIVLVVPSFPKLSETFIVSKFLGLLDRGWDVHIVCGDSNADEWARFPQLQAHPELRGRVHTNWPHRPRALSAALIAPALLRCLMRNPKGTSRYLLRRKASFGADVLRKLYLDAEIIALAPDLVHFEFGTLAVGRTHLKDLLGCKLVASFRGYDLNYVGLSEPGYYSEVWEHTDALHLLGEDLWRRAQQRGCPSNKPHALIPPAIDAQFFDPGSRRHTDVAGTADRPLRILSVGRLEWKKGYDYALEAVKLLVARGLHCEYNIVGHGEYLEAIAFARHQLGLEASVRLQGAKPRAEVRTQMQSADVFLHSAVSEGFCNAALEAQAMMLPVVCSDADGLSENVMDGETGFVVPRRNAEALAGRLATLASNPGLRQAMGEAGRRRVQRHFAPGDQITSFERLYQRVLGETEQVKREIAHERSSVTASQTVGDR